MKRILLLAAAICTIQTASAQVGINNTDPKAQLDISAGATASEMDGLLIPRLDEYPTGVGADQDGMLIFVTGDGTPTKGFYYWDQGIPAWVPIIGAADTDWTIVGADIERQSGDAYIGDDATTNNKLVISGVIEDWDDPAFLLDPNSESIVKEINYDAGSVTDPSIHFDADTTTGFYRPEADAIGITADGNDKFRFTEQGQLEFYNNGEAVFIGESAGQNDDHMNRQNIAIGYRALRDNVSGARNIAIGSGALFASTGGTANIAIGDDAMVANASGNSNVGLGIQSLYKNISGSNNTALGGTAMRENTGGSNNTALGFRALYNNTTTNGNVAVGFDAGFENIAGTNNTYLGFNAGHLNMGDRSVFIGANSGFNELGSNKLYIENSNADADNALIYGEFDNNILRTNGQFQIGNPSGTGYAFPTVDGTVGQVLTSDGAGNISFATSVSGVEKIDDLLDGKSDSDGTQDGSSIFLGVNAGAADDSSNNRNIGIGYLAMEDNVDGDANTAIGYSALLNNIDGSANTAVGAASLDANTSGIWNTAVGQASLSGNVDGFYNTAVGRSALVNNIDGDSNVAMGVNALGANTTGSFNTVLGVDAANASSDGSSNTVIGRRAMNSHTAGSNNVALGASAGYYGDGIQNTYLGTTAGFSPSSPTRDGSVFVGYGAGSAELTSNKLYIENSTADADNALVYGEFDNNILRTNGELQVGNPTGTGYAFPTIDGTSGQVLTSDGAGQLAFSNATVDTQNTLDGAYDEGGAGLGRIITADAGAISIEGEDGFQITGTFGSGDNIALSGAGTRLFFNPRKAAFRAGDVSSTQWNDANIGDYSFATGRDNRASGVYSSGLGFSNVSSGGYATAFGRNNTASGDHAVAGSINNTASGLASVAFGNSNTSSGDFSTTFGSLNNASGARSFAAGSLNTATGFTSNTFGFNSTAVGTASTAMGNANTAHSAYETVLGSFSTNYTATNTNAHNTSDRVFTVGNGVNDITRSNALTIYKSGLININDAYSLPLADGTAGQTLITDGAGQLSFGTAAASGWSLTGNTILGSHFLGSTNNADVQFRTNNSEKMRLTTSGQLEFYNTGNSVFIGEGAGENDDLSNNNNTFVGYRAGQDIVDGFGNTALGHNALQNATSGVRNVALGSGSLTGNTTGDDNIAIGSSVMVSNTTGAENIAIGYATLFEKEMGDSNVAVGYRAGAKDVFSDQNVYVGHEAGGGFVPDPDESKSGNVFIGYRAGYDVDGDDQLVIENSDATTPLIYGTFNTNEVGINWNATTALPNTLSVNGNASKSVAGAWLANSDRRLKKEITTIEGTSALHKLNQLRGVTYFWNDDKTGIERPDEIQYGFIAQEIQEVFPEKVTKDCLGFYQTAYGDYDALFVQAIKELNNKISTLEEKNQKLEAQLEAYKSLEFRLSVLEKDSDNFGNINDISISEEKK